MVVRYTADIAEEQHTDFHPISHNPSQLTQRSPARRCSLPRVPGFFLTVGVPDSLAASPLRQPYRVFSER
jgi:hypothetical protein